MCQTRKYSVNYGHTIDDSFSCNRGRKAVDFLIIKILQLKQLDNPEAMARRLHIGPIAGGTKSKVHVA